MNPALACCTEGIKTDSTNSVRSSCIFLKGGGGGGIKDDFVCLKSEMRNKGGQVSKQSVEVPVSCQAANNGLSACR